MHKFVRVLDNPLFLYSLVQEIVAVQEVLTSQPSPQSLLRFQDGGAGLKTLENAAKILQESWNILLSDAVKYGRVYFLVI